jgi:hypothetical protein
MPHTTDFFKLVLRTRHAGEGHAFEIRVGEVALAELRFIQPP